MPGRHSRIAIRRYDSDRPSVFPRGTALRGGLRGLHAEGIVIRSEDLHKAGSLELRGAAPSAIFDTLNGSKCNME